MVACRSSNGKSSGRSSGGSGSSGSGSGSSGPVIQKQQFSTLASDDVSQSHTLQGIDRYVGN